MGPASTQNWRLSPLARAQQHAQCPCGVPESEIGSARSSPRRSPRSDSACGLRFFSGPFGPSDDLRRSVMLYCLRFLRSWPPPARSRDSRPYQRLNSPYRGSGSLDLRSAFSRQGLPQNLWVERRAGSPRQTHSVPVCSPPSRRVAPLRPRCAGLTAWTPAARTSVPALV